MDNTRLPRKYGAKLTLNYLSGQYFISYCKGLGPLVNLYYMSYKQPHLVSGSTRNPQKQLQVLYARRCTLDAVIRHLEEYRRCRTRRPDPLKRKSA